MKLIILGAGSPNSISVESDVAPACLSRFDDSEAILDKTLGISGSIGNCEQIFVGGYRVLDVIQAYPELRYYYNPEWEKTGSLATLLRADSEFDGDLIVAYSDVVHEPTVIERMLREQGDILVSFDSLWKHRYEGREASSTENVEIVKRDADGSLAINRNHLSNVDQNGGEELGEFTGLLIFRKTAVEGLVPIFERLVSADPTSSIISAIQDVGKKFTVTPVDLSGRWAELDSETDLAQFKFGTKAETLSRLQNTLTQGTVLPQEMVSAGEWKSAPAEVLERVRSSFQAEKEVVVRSSGLAEDSEVSSMAGEFESVLGVSIHEGDELSDSIGAVSKSFQKTGQDSFDGNQILIQPMLTDVVCAGVIFTEDLETSAPYYIVNYDESGSTDSITSGAGGDHQTLVIAKNLHSKIKDSKMNALVAAVKEVEKKTGYHSLDIEFAIKMEGSGNESEAKIYILQVRPIAAQKDKLKVSAKDVENELAAIKKYIAEDRGESAALCGNEVAYGVMPDWNPAEIVGINPRPLAFSIYRSIITDQVWGKSRKQCGYRDTRPRPGLVSFAGKPYVDIRMSFTSFVPETLEERLANRLVDHALGYLRMNEELHDKVEFDVMPTAYDLNFKAARERLLNDGFDQSEVGEIEEAYRKLTNNILGGGSTIVEQELGKVSDLEKKRLAVAKRVKAGSAGWNDVVNLLDDCRKLGTLPFSNLARFAFVGVIQLKGLVARQVLSQERCNEFLASIQTVAKDFVNDLAVDSREQLIEAYGHLRPGTYDVTCPAYHEKFDSYVDLSNRPDREELSKFSLNQTESEKISEALMEDGFLCDTDQLFSFIEAAIIGREKGKFEFTKNLSLAIDLIIQFTADEGISRDDLSYLEIDDIVKLAGMSSPNNLSSIWKETISKSKRRHSVSSAIKLPPVIFSEDNIDAFYLPTCQPNFVTQKSASAEIAVLSESAVSVEGKICLIENADPGFDWLFSHNIAGLVTAYGGANSHMAIRCAEFEIPAVIGCGESLFAEISSARKLLLNCGSQKIEMIK